MTAGQGQIRTRSTAWAPLGTAFFCVLCAIAVVFGTTNTAHARAVNDTEKAMLAKVVSAFETAIKTPDYQSVVDMLPPKIMSAIAAKANLSVSFMRNAVVGAMASAMAKVSMESFSLDMSGAEYKELGNGNPYALIPTRTVMSAPDAGRFAQTSHTLGVLDDAKWYLMRVSDTKQLTILREVYPEFNGVKFPRGTMEALKP